MSLPAAPSKQPSTQAGIQATAPAAPAAPDPDAGMVAATLAVIAKHYPDRGFEPEAREALNEFTPSWVLRAVCRAVAEKKEFDGFSYIKGILRNWVRAGGPKPGKEETAGPWRDLTRPGAPAGPPPAPGPDPAEIRRQQEAAARQRRIEDAEDAADKLWDALPDPEKRPFIDKAKSDDPGKPDIFYRAMARRVFIAMTLRAAPGPDSPAGDGAAAESHAGMNF